MKKQSVSKEHGHSKDPFRLKRATEKEKTFELHSCKNYLLEQLKGEFAQQSPGFDGKTMMLCVFCFCG